MKNKKWTGLLLVSLLVLIFITMMMNYIVDPFQQYRIASWYEITDKKQREIIPGLAKNIPAETIIIGSSMVENFRASFIDDELGTTSLKLCAAGMTAYEMQQLLNTIISNNHNVKHIILGLDLYALSGDVERIRNSGFPYYLYDNNPLNDISYLLNQEALHYSYKMIRENRGKVTNFDDMWYWGDDYTYSKKNVLASYDKNNFNSSFKLQDYQYDVLQKSFSFNLLPVIKANKNIEFTLFYPPYSYLTYRDMRDKKWLKEAFKAKKYISSLQEPNLSVYDFQCVTSITEDLNNYKDVSHYSPDINKYIISSIKNNRHLVRADNIDRCLSIIQNSANLELGTGDGRQQASP